MDILTQPGRWLRCQERRWTLFSVAGWQNREAGAAEQEFEERSGNQNTESTLSTVITESTVSTKGTVSGKEY